MGSVKVILPDNMEEEFRDEVYKSKGMKKGNITKAIKEAIVLWMNTESEKRSEAAKKAWKKRKEKGK